MKTFFDGTFVSEDSLKETDIKYPIKLEYYKTLEEENVVNKYGIEIVKTEYIDGKTYTESKRMNNITNSLEEEEKILKLLKNNEVTPIGLEDVLKDLIV